MPHIVLQSSMSIIPAQIGLKESKTPDFASQPLPKPLGQGEQSVFISFVGPQTLTPHFFLKSCMRLAACALNNLWQR